jgi:hypothetical protein
MPQPDGRTRGLGTAADAPTERGRWGLAPGSETADTSYRFPVVHAAEVGKHTRIKIDTMRAWSGRDDPIGKHTMEIGQRIGCRMVG